MTCTGHASTHNHLNVRTYYIPLTGGQTVDLCQGCYEGLTAPLLGMDLIPIERRDTATRPFTPPWLKRLKAKDMSGHAA